ncbi:hypothetical protein [Nocardia neocaledoniensis]|uniref:hypothetical protein n=1 Tax=Nocardia neocaledoniensis TaxID=236511 RepID=UPI002455AAB2|nr:hypothetical protein [Nocardia neocaledoniensis]
MSGERPLQDLLTEAAEGRLSVTFGGSVRLDAEEFVYIERECKTFLDLITELQRTATDISNREVWGLGEAVAELTSAQTLVRRFREKGQGSDNSVHAVLEQHYQIVEDLQVLHRTIAQKFQASDAEFASRYNELMAAVPQPGTPGGGDTAEDRA